MVQLPYSGKHAGMAALFDWDPAKDDENQRKHGVAFRKAQLAFLDPRRVIADDLAHSMGERRFYRFGRVVNRVMTVRFTVRDSTVRIIGAGYWRRGRRLYEAIQRIHG
jgi:uncharacterized DUF497 family protein